MFLRKKEIVNDGEKLLVSFDLEWTKNYKIKNGNRPFCFSFVFFCQEKIQKNIEKLDFGFYSCYIETNKEAEELVQHADCKLKEFIDAESIVIGHQLSSDISVMLNFGEPHYTRNFSKLYELWHNRRQTIQQEKIFDTRYDLNTILNGQSRRLVDVCEELKLDVTQPELKGSMTKMHNDYINNKSIHVMEKLSVMNLRHGLSAALLYLYYKRKYEDIKPVNVNRIIFNNLNSYYNYVDSDHFKVLLK